MQTNRESIIRNPLGDLVDVVSRLLLYGEVLQINHVQLIEFKLLLTQMRVIKLNAF